MPQVPTARGVKIRSAADAHLLFYAVHLGRLPMIQRRLDASERAEVVSGSVFVWEERSAASTSLPGNQTTEPDAESGATSGIVSGIERWTDGLKWGPSRVRDDFLFYQEKDPNEKESLISPPPVLAHSTHGPYRSQSGKHGAKLIKQTYSVHYYPQVLEGKPPSEPARKWHLTAYHSVHTIDRLADVMAIPELHNLASPPDGLFKKARVGKKPVGPTSNAQITSPSTSRAPMIRTGSESWQDPPSSSSQGPFTPSTEGAYSAPQPRISHHPGAQSTIRYAPNGYSHPQQQPQPHARSMSLGYAVETPPPHYAHPHPQHQGRSGSISEHGPYHAPYHAYEYPPRPSAQFSGYYPPPNEPHPSPYYGYPHSRSQSYNGPPTYPYHAPQYHHHPPPPPNYPQYDRDPAMAQPDSPSEMHMTRRISFPPPPQTYDHPFAYQPPPLAPSQGEAPARQLPTPPAQSPEHRYAIPAPNPSTSGQYYPATFDSTPDVAPNPQTYGSPHPAHLVRSPPSGVVRTTRATRRTDETDARVSENARGAHFSPYGRPVNHAGPRHHPAIDSSASATSGGHFDPFHPPTVEQSVHSRSSSMPANAYPPRPSTDSRTQQHPTGYPYDATPSQWANGSTPVALQTQSAYPMPADTGTQFRHATTTTTTEEQTPPEPVVAGHFQPQLEPLVNPDGSPPFTHFRSSSGTDIANITGASRGSSSSTGAGIANTHAPLPPPPPPRLDMHMTGDSTTSQTSATSATGAGVSSKLGPLTPSTFHQRDPEDERVLELLSRVAPGTTTPVATASGQPLAVNGDGDNANDAAGPIE